MASTSIEIEGLRIFARHGVLPQESVVGNEFELNITLKFDGHQAMTMDSLAHSVNYAAVIQIVKQEMAVRSQLLENVVHRIHHRLCASFPSIRGGKIQLYKLQPPIACEVARVGFTYKW